MKVRRDTAPVVDNATYDLPAPPESAAPPPTGAPLPAEDRIVSLADLDAEARRQLPPLKLWAGAEAA